MSALVAIHRLLCFHFCKSFNRQVVVGERGRWVVQQVRKTNNSTCLFLFSVLDYIFVIEAQNNAVETGKKATQALEFKVFLVCGLFCGQFESLPELQGN